MINMKMKKIELDLLIIYFLTFFYVCRCLRKRNVEENIIQNFQRNKVKKMIFNIL